MVRRSVWLNTIIVNLWGLFSEAMLKPILIGLSLAVLFDAAAFGGAYRDKIAGAGVRVVVSIFTQDWKLTHK
jgi:hypothetical protein